MKSNALVVILLLLSFTINAQLCLNTPINRSLQYGPLETVSSDFNLDGKADVAIIPEYSFNPGIIQILLGNGDNTFGAAVNFSVGNSPTGLKTGDFNNDGKPDLAVANYGTNYVSVLLGLGTGSFVAATSYTFGGSAYTLNCNDFNGDGNLDMAVTSATNVSIFSGLGTGSFSSPISYSVGVNANIITSSDLNNDGKLDLMLASSAFNSPYIFVAMGLATGGYSTVVLTSVGNSPTAIICNDFNDDGIKDVVVTNASNSYRSVLIGNGNGGFSNVLLNGCIEGEAGVANADFNNDGKQDLAIANSINCFISVLLGSGETNAYSVFDRSRYTTGMDPQSVACADFNEDGYLDLIVGNRTSKTLSVLNGNGNGKFTGARLTGVNPYPSFTTTPDLDNDGNSDLVIGHSNSNSASVMLNVGSGQTFIPWWQVYFSSALTNLKSTDLNNDGNMDLVAVNGNTNTIAVVLGLGNGNFGSLTNYTLSSSPRDIAIGDFNNDGYSDLAVTQITNNLSVLLGSSTGSLSSVINYSVSSLHIGVVTNDYNNDGKLDLVTMSHNSNSFYVSLGLGNGNFAPEVSYNAPGAYPLQISGITSKDFNNDAIADLALIQTNISTGAANITIYIATGIGSFTNSAIYSINAGSKSITSADYNGDGKLDLALASSNFGGGGNGTYNNVSLFLGSGNGTFGTAINYNVGIDPIVVENADFNNDDKMDLVTINFASDNISVIINGPQIEITSANSICEGSNTPLVAYGANTYSWSTNANTNNINVSPIVNTTYTVTGTTTSGCIGSAVKTISVIASPSISVNSGTICSGSSFTITPSGTHTYTFSSGTAIVSPISTSSYTVFGTDTITKCTGNAISAIYVDQACQDVWPGDVNSDGVANNLDVLELGLHYTQTGLPRATMSNTWQSYFANNWTGTISNGKNLNHSDCNGDGTIDDTDTLAIYTNYGLTHAFKSSETSVINPQLSIIPDQLTVVKGNWGTASIYLGDISNPVTSINGIAFTIDFNKNLIEPNNIYIEYQNSFLDASQNLHFRKLNFLNGKIYTATTHTISNNVTGYGKIATLHYQIKSNLITDQVLNIGVSLANQSDALGTIAPLTTGTGTLMAIGNSVGLTKNLTNYLISVTPNPTNGLLIINSISELQKIEITSITGQVLLSEITTNSNHTLNLGNYSNGIYFINIYDDNRIVKREKVIVNN
jgi:hypothetical protein